MSNTYVYVTNSGSNTVSVIDTSTKTVIDTISVGSKPTAILANNQNSKVYVSNSLDNTISVIDTNNRTVVATIPVGEYPSGLSILSNDSTLYVANRDADVGIDHKGSISIIDTGLNQVVDVLAVSPSPVASAVNPQDTLVYVAANFPGNIDVVKAASVIDIDQTFSVNGSATDVQITPNGLRLFVLNDNDTSGVQVFSLPFINYDESIVDQLYFCSRVHFSAMDDLGLNYYATVTAELAPPPVYRLYRINVNTITEESSVVVGNSPRGVVYEGKGNLVYVAISGNNTVSVVNANATSILQNINVGLAPWGLAVVTVGVPLPVPKGPSPEITGILFCQ